MAKKKPEPSWLVVAYRRLFDVAVEEHEGRPPAALIVKGRWKARDEAAAALGPEADAAVYRATAAVWHAEHGRCPLVGSPGRCAPCACPLQEAA